MHPVHLPLVVELNYFMRAAFLAHRHNVSRLQIMWIIVLQQPRNQSSSYLSTNSLSDYFALRWLFACSTSSSLPDWNNRRVLAECRASELLCSARIYQKFGSCLAKPWSRNRRPFIRSPSTPCFSFFISETAAFRSASSLFCSA